MNGAASLEERFDDLERRYREVINENIKLEILVDHLKQQLLHSAERLAKALESLAKALGKKSTPSLTREETRSTPGWASSKKDKLTVSVSAIKPEWKPRPQKEQPITINQKSANAPTCRICTILMVRRGPSCFVCLRCGYVVGVD
jgi:hypothetical protein